MIESDTEQPNLQADSPHVFILAVCVWSSPVAVETHGKRDSCCVVSHNHKKAKVSHPIADCLVSVVFVKLSQLKWEFTFILSVFCLADLPFEPIVESVVSYVQRENCEQSISHVTDT